MARIISISNLKGGSGKTTSAVNIAAALALQKHRVLVVDTDPQAHATLSLGVQARKAGVDLHGVLVERKPMEDAIRDTSTAGLWVIPASKRLVYFEKNHSTDKEARKRLSSVLSEVESRYDYVIVDTPPTISLLTISSLIASNEVVIPMQAHYLALKGLVEMLQLLHKINRYYNQNLALTGIIPTFFNGSAKLSKAIVGEIRKQLGEHIILPPVRSNIALAEAPRFGKSIFEYRKQSPGAVDYLRIAHAIQHPNREEGPPQNDRSAGATTS